MERLVNRAPLSDGSEPADGLKIKLAAAHCLIADLRETKKQHEGIIDSLSSVSSAECFWMALMWVAWCPWSSMVAVVQVIHAVYLQEIQGRKLESSTQSKQLNATILHLEEKLARYLKIEEEFTSLETPLGYTHESFLELITKFNETKVILSPVGTGAI